MLYNLACWDWCGPNAMLKMCVRAAGGGVRAGEGQRGLGTVESDTWLAVMEHESEQLFHIAQLVEERASVGLGHVSVMARTSPEADGGAPEELEGLQPLSVNAPVQVQKNALIQYCTLIRCLWGGGGAPEELESR